MVPGLIFGKSILVNKPFAFVCPSAHRSVSELLSRALFDLLGRRAEIWPWT